MTRLATLIFIVSCISAVQPAYGQEPSIDKRRFFNDTAIVRATITTNWRKLFGTSKKKGLSLPATFTVSLSDQIIQDSIVLEVRGNFRRHYCYLPPLKLNFTNGYSVARFPFKSLKLVNECSATNDYGQLLLKEFLIYKIYNLLTDKSFRVRLLRLNFKDSNARAKDILEYAFLLENSKDLAKRNHCTEWKKPLRNQEATDRKQMTLVAIFEYMIGNTDWSVTGGHNALQIVSKEDSLAAPFAVPYDFDFSGLVATNYSVPDETLNIESVKERVYRGYPRTIAEINEVLDVFKQQKDKIYDTINNFELLNKVSKKEMTSYLDEFYSTISNPREITSIFINDARK